MSARPYIDCSSACRRMARYGSLLMLLCAAALLSGCAYQGHTLAPQASDSLPQSVVSTQIGPAPDDTVTVYSVKGPIVLRYRDLVVPEDAAPERGADPREIEGEIRAAFGSLLASVSVVATSAGEYADASCLAHYTLVDCPVVASTILLEFTEDGFIPPLTQYSGTPLGRDRMSAERFRTLLGAYGAVSDSPFGILDSYRSAVDWSDSPLAPSATTVDVNGRTRPVEDVWVVSPGATSLAQYLTMSDDQMSDDHPSQRTAYIFYFPKGADPEYLGRAKGIGRFHAMF